MYTSVVDLTLLPDRRNSPNNPSLANFGMLNEMRNIYLVINFNVLYEGTLASEIMINLNTKIYILYLY